MRKVMIVATVLALSGLASGLHGQGSEWVPLQ